MDNQPEADDLVVVEKDDRSYDQRLKTIRERDAIDSKYGYERYTDPPALNAWLVNVQPAEMMDTQTKAFYSVTDFYFLAENGGRFKISYPFRPYLYLATTPGAEFRVSTFLSKKYPLLRVEHVEKDDLDLKNHLSGLKSKFLHVSFPSTVEQAAFKKDIFPIIRKNQAHLKAASDYTTMLSEHMGARQTQSEGDILDDVIEIREYDLPYHMRVCIDERIFVGLWYRVVGRDVATQLPVITRNTDLIDPPDPVICAFDIETTKEPLKFPDAEHDQIMMISYMIDGEGFLIINRTIVSEDIRDFEYTPKPEFKGNFSVFNEVDEKALIERFFDHMLLVKPHIMVTYNGDFFDWPFVETRAQKHGLDMHVRIGFYKDNMEEYKHINCIHMDAFRWVKRDSYLPVGSQNLKATTKAKLRYDPIELDPELMVEMARTSPQTLASYSVSDAVATYYLYMKYVHPFIFALCTIIPLGPDDVLRKGSGTLCEALLMVEAFHKSIIFPNKQIAETHKMTTDGHLIESETYVGGHVEALESGIFRADIPTKFRIDIPTIRRLQEEVPDTLRYSLEHEMGVDMSKIVDFDDVVAQVKAKLEELTDNPLRTENPKIYHLDVGAMYPNIILTNRLQPPAVVDETDCLACVYNKPDAECRRNMNWVWRGELIPAKRGEYERLMQQLEQERFGKPPRPFHSLKKDEQLVIEKKRIQDYCKKSYGKVHVTRVETRTSVVCERENAFYVNTVRAFRDRRYDYKALLKKAKNALGEIPVTDVAGVKTGQARVVLYESLQLAHKCILNSFYGYVMRKGSRWFSMEMAGIVCHTGANIITEARQLVELIGRPLELDTDGIWCLLPSSFPEDYKLKTTEGKTVTVSYPGAMLNAVVKENFTNDQYHNLLPDGKSYSVSSENSIFFEVDGPYLAMILPASKEEGKKLKKRYAVFNFDGSLAELKGFEVKRRGELAIIKEFQKEVFKAFLGGSNTQEAYASVAKVADNWLDILFTKGADLSDEELFALISENRSMSRKLEDYGAQKSTSITTAKRLSEFLGPEVVKNAGLACRYVISSLPAFSPVTDRAIPLAIFQSDPNVAAHYLRKWTSSNKINTDNINIREILDWPYYIERLGNCIQKIITIPAALQGIPNPVPRVPHPEWLENMRRRKIELITQPKITDIFKKAVPANNSDTPTRPGRSATTTPMRKRPHIAIFTGDEEPVSNDVEDEYSNDAVGAAGIKRPRVDGTPGSVTAWAQSQRQRASTQGTPASQSRNASDLMTNRANKKTWAKDGFYEWLKYLKSKWSKMRLEHRRNRNSAASNFATGQTSLECMVTANRNRLRSEIWHILQISETRTPGVFDAFALVGDVMRRFTLKIPRIFYVNDLTPRDSGSSGASRAVQRSLPRLQPCYNLYEYAVDEAQFSAKLNDFNAQLCAGNIAGIYETQLPLLFRAFVEIGAACRISTFSASSVLSLSQMEKAVEPGVDALVHLKYFYFYEYTQSSRTVAGFFTPDPGARGYVFIVNKAKISVPPVNSTFSTEFEKFERRSAGVLPPEVASMKVEVIQTASIKEVGRQIAGILKATRSNPSQPGIVAIQSNRLQSEVLEAFPAFKELPSVKIRISEPPNLMNVLEWAQVMVKRAIQHFFNSFVYFTDYCAMASYIGIPIGNLTEDVVSLALDVFFARALKQQNYVLWASPSSTPDFGGKESDDLRLAVDWETSAFKHNHRQVINVPSADEKHCIAELELGALAVTALIQHHRIIEAEGASEFVGFTSGVSTGSIDKLIANGLRPTTANVTEFDESASVAGPMRVLRQVFHELISDIHTHENIFADQLVGQMYRWISDSNSLLYNPALSRAVNMLMRKLELLLATEINRLGGSVIHASFTKLVFSTNRLSALEAKIFVSSIIDTLAMSPVFASLHLVPVHLWSFCLWIDASNYASITFPSATSSSQNENDDIAVLNDTQDQENSALTPQRIDSHFAMINNLPSNCKTAIVQLVVGYFTAVAREAKSASAEDSDVAAVSKALFQSEVVPRLFKITERLVGMRDTLNAESSPQNLKIDIPTEFVKTTCYIFSTYKCLSDDVDLLHLQLIRSLETTASVSELTWRQPTVVCVLDTFFCAHCNRCVDIDFDKAAPVLLSGEGEEEAESSQAQLSCPHCNHHIDHDVVEELLLDRLSRLTSSFTLQDSKCVKCGLLATRYLAKFCECSNALQLVVTREELQQNLATLSRVAKRFGFDTVDQAATWYQMANDL